MSLWFVLSAVTAVAPTFVVGHANGVTLLGLVGMAVTGTVISHRNKVRA